MLNTPIFGQGTSGRIDFADGSFDALVASTLLSHVDDPLSELKKGAGAPVKGKAYDETLIRAVITNPRVMRQMPRLLRTAGFELVTSFSHLPSEAGTANFRSSAIETYRKLIPKAGVITEDDANACAADLHKDSDARVCLYPLSELRIAEERWPSPENSNSCSLP